MAGISEIVQVTITATTRTPSRQGFGTPMVMGYHTRFTELFRVYTSFESFESDGFSATNANGSAIWYMASALMKQNPRPASFKVGRLTSAPTQTKTLTVTSNTEGEHIKVKVTSPLGVLSSIDYTIPAAQTLTQVATAVAALIDALAGVAAVGAVAVITITASTPGQVFFLRDFTNCTVKDTTTLGTYVTDLTALVAVEDDWYFLALDINSSVITDGTNGVASWVETRVKELVIQSQDAGEPAGSGTYGSTLKGLSLARTQGMWHTREDQYPACAWVGSVAPKDPGSITWRFRKLVGVTPLLLNPTQETNLTAAGWNWYSSTKGLGIVLPGVTFAGEYPDVQHGTDWLTARIQERVLGILANADKVTYEDPSVDMLCAEIKSVLVQGEGRKFLKKGTSVCTGPKVADVAVEDRAARILPDIEFTADLAGAIHKVQVRGTLSV